ncbi:hypothetical protein RDWZM_001607 [Blomia tropicalis]|uniref:Serine/threonine-protein phosphatase n=1 Tax=Blomia tropicalis TaxID=40697 RepID=A0A9Q0MEM0_BLOTA|nr:hypothetical protein BLOT_007799 [Blomia tropicalis]KAJ6223062.1 hypothetical protein RDWZM_001607 [Blomia tropicalis]
MNGSDESDESILNVDYSSSSSSSRSVDTNLKRNTSSLHTRVTNTSQYSSNSREFPMKYAREVNIPHLTPCYIGPMKKSEITKFDSSSYSDILVYVIHCPKHEKIAVHQEKNGGIKWLPFSHLFPNKSLGETALIGSIYILAEEKDDKVQSVKDSSPVDSNSIQLYGITRMQLPQTLSFITRYIFYIKLKETNGKFRCCNSTSTIVWTPIVDISTNQVPNIWGPELVQYCRLTQQNFVGFSERIDEFSLDDVYLYAPRDPPRNAEETMLLDLDFSEKTIELLYHEFLDHCYPCFSLTIDSFKHYMSKYGLSGDERLNSLFFAFNYNKNGYISFHELLMGLVSLEPTANHNEVRVKFVFRYFDAGSKGFLDMKDFEAIIASITDLDGVELATKLDECVRLVGTVDKDRQKIITFNNFMNAIGSHRLRGTSTLIRARWPVFNQLTRAFIRSKKSTTTDLKEWYDLKNVLISRSYKGLCRPCKSIRYKLATHSISMNQNGYVEKPVRISSRTSSAAPVDPNSVEFMFNANSVSNIVLNMVRNFNPNKGTTKTPKGLLDGPKNANRLLDLVKKLHTDLLPILDKGSRCPNISSPCIVIGDIHGNLEDLLTHEKVLWRSAPCFGPNYLFLGDYVDRGKWGLECAIYLFALKLLDPVKIILLRGNHEVRALQEKYTYKKELLQKYGNEIGEKIWQLTNEIFDRLPIAATIDNAIFCVHGGLSPHAQTLDQIKEMNGPLNNPEQQSRIAWELLWSDPCHMQQYLDYIELNDVSNELAQEGYLPNQKRGAAFLFNERAAKNFLSRNGLSHMIRAHEVPPFGFTHHFENLCTTVFSCSHYCSNDNEAACILVHENRIRAIRIDTHNNAPATDK